jgi:NAD(P)-dependent dehydrogenase (short-subunit alcohol dehydrogenase family)
VFHFYFMTEIDKGDVGMSDGRVVLVTGAAYGIGRGIALHFASRGDSILLADVNIERGTLLEAAIREDGGNAIFVHTDVRDESAVQKAIDRAVCEWGKLDVLCNDAGVETYRRADELTLQDWNEMMETNLRGAFFCSKYAFPFLQKTKGCIVNISSVQGLACERHGSVYAATKAGLLALTRGMAIDFAPFGVRVNAICPGAIHSGMMEAFLAKESDPDAIIASMSKRIPLGFIGRPEHIAGVAYFLASPDAAYITGTWIGADGGLLARLAL